MIHGLVWLRALLPFLVVFIHMNLFNNLSLMTKQETYPIKAFDLIWIAFFQSAVPLFFCISLLLYLLKREKLKLNKYNHLIYLKKRILYFTGQFLLWRSIYAIFGISYLWNNKSGLMVNIYRWVMGGGNTPLYFILNLIYLYIIIELSMSLQDKIQKHSFTTLFELSITFISVGLLYGGYFLPWTIRIEYFRFYCLFNFIPTIPVAFFLKKLYKKEISNLWLCISFLLFVISLLLEIKYLPNSKYLDSGYSVALPGYGRPSLYFFSFFVIGYSFKIKNNLPIIINFLASTSWEVFVLHLIFINLFTFFPNKFICIILVLTASYSTAWLLLRIKQKIKINKLNDNSLI